MSLSSFTPRGFRVVLLLIAAMGLATAAGATEPREAGLDDLVIFPPNNHERGLPKVDFVADGDNLKVDIAPTVHVHRYYYSGDREYQGPLIAGGPSVIVANHPKSNERLYINVMLPSGAPIISYDKNSITYIYPNYRVEVCFLPFFRNKYAVKYLQGEGLARKAHETGAKLRDCAQAAVKNSKVSDTLAGAARGTGQLAVGTVGALGVAADAGLQTAGKVVSVVPGVRPLTSAARDLPQERYLTEISRAEQRNIRQNPDFLRTNR